MRPILVYGLPAAAAVALFAATRALYLREDALAREHWVLAVESTTGPVRASFEGTFRSMYEGLRTIARLPSVRRLVRGRDLDSDARTTAQEVYNNLAMRVDMSEVYVVPVDFDPDSVDPRTGHAQEPLIAFDELIVGRQADAHEDGHEHAELEEIEIHEYRQMRAQIARFSTICPQEDRVKGLAYPALFSTEVITCDNRYFSPKRPDERDRMGLVYSVPFFDETGRLAGCISGVILTRSLRDMLSSGNLALVHSAHDYAAMPRFDGLWQEHEGDIRNAVPSPDLLHSKIVPLDVDDDDRGFLLWTGHSERDFADSVHAAKAESFLHAAAGSSAIFVLALLFATRSLARQRKLDRTREHQLELARDAAEEHARAKSNFIAVASHEIRTPMNGVLGMTELMLQGELPPSQRELADTARRSARVLVDLLQGILDFSRLEAHHLELHRAPFDPITEVEDIAQLLAPVAAKGNLRLCLWFADSVPRAVLGDAGRVRQVLTNLVGNALKFTERGTVTVRVAATTREGAPHLRYEVVDTGIGLSPALKPRLFQPFTQADASTTRRFGGSGLGLAICRGLVEVMGGVIDYDPTPAGGTTFWMELPLELAPNHVATSAARPLAGQRIVLVDGDPTQRQCLSQSVRLLGADVRAFADSTGAATEAAWATCALVEHGNRDLGGNVPTVRYSPLGGPAESAEPLATSATSPRQLLLPARLEQLSNFLSAAVVRAA
ncbi:MAG: ATP-binding protein, partial [Planctomycetota bacterium]